MTEDPRNEPAPDAPTNPYGYDPGTPYGQPAAPQEPEQPTSPYGQSPYGQPPQQPDSPYGQSPYGQAPYAQSPYAQSPYGQQGYGQETHPQSGYAQPQQHNPYGPVGVVPPGPSLPSHPSATTSMVLGLIGLVSLITCLGVGLILSPFAWAMGSKALKEIDASGGTLGGGDQARAGQVMGIIGTTLLVLGVLAIAAIIGLVAFGSSTTTYSEY